MYYSAVLDSSSEYASFAVADQEGNQIYIAEHSIPCRKLSAKLLSTLLELLKKQSISLQAIQNWSIGLGPGSFNGIRVGIALVQGICLGSGARYRGLPSSLALATMCIQDKGYPNATIAVLYDGKRNAFLLNLYRCDVETIKAIDKPRLIDVMELSALKVDYFVTLDTNGKLKHIPRHILNRLTIYKHLEANYLLNPKGWDWSQNSRLSENNIEAFYGCSANFGIVKS